MRHGLRKTQKLPGEIGSRPAKIAQCEASVLDRSMSATEAFVAVARGCIAHIAAAAEAAQLSDDPEAIHQLRVGLRRLRAAFSVFSAALPRRRPAILRQSHALQQQLGAARELDVLLDETIASMPDDLRNRCEMGEFITAAEEIRVARHRLSSSQYDSMLIRGAVRGSGVPADGRPGRMRLFDSVGIIGIRKGE